MKFYDNNLEPCPGEPIANNTYENKPLKWWNADDFSGFVLDNSDSKLNFIANGTFIEHDATLLEYLEHIPEKHPRIYLYGVWHYMKALLKDV